MVIARPRLRLAFCDFWGDFDPADNYFTRLLGPHYEVELSSDPDVLIYSVFGRAFERFQCPRILYTGEARRPNFHECDYAISFDYPHLGWGGRNYRLPFFALAEDPSALVRAPSFDPSAALAAKTRFCAFVYTGYSPSRPLPGHERRLRLFEKLSRYKRVDSGGRLRNNLGFCVVDKRAFLRDYKFSIAFENTAMPGYTTEKLFDALVVEGMPIHWGDPLAARDFDPRRFIRCQDFGSLDEVVERVIALDRDDALYLEHLRVPPYRENRVPAALLPGSLLAWLSGILARPERLRGDRPVRAYVTRASRRIGREAASHAHHWRLRLGGDV